MHLDFLFMEFLDLWVEAVECRLCCAELGCENSLQMGFGLFCVCTYPGLKGSMWARWGGEMRDA